jgi:hypothetical protein
MGPSGGLRDTYGYRRCSGGRTRTLNNWTRTSRVADYTTPEWVGVQISRAARSGSQPAGHAWARCFPGWPVENCLVGGSPGTKWDSEVLGMVRWSVGVAALVMGLGATGVSAVPAEAGTPGMVIKVTPSQGLKAGQTVTVTGHGLPKTAGSASQTWFLTECTAAVRGRVNPATDTAHCDITHAQALKVTKSGTFSARYRLTTGIIGDGYCGTAGHAACVIGVGTAQGLGTVMRITFKIPAVSLPGAVSTTTSTTAA